MNDLNLDFRSLNGRCNSKLATNFFLQFGFHAVTPKRVREDQGRTQPVISRFMTEYFSTHFVLVLAEIAASFVRH